MFPVQFCAGTRCLQRLGGSGEEYRGSHFEVDLTQYGGGARYNLIFGYTDTGLLRKEWHCLKVARVRHYFVWSPWKVRMVRCDREEYERPKKELDWWRRWVAEQRTYFKANGKVKVTHRPGANIRWYYDKVWQGFD